MVLTRINNNVSAFNAARNLGSTSAQLGKSLERLSSGLRINRAADDAAGLSISESQRSQIRGLSRAIQNAQDATSLINTAEGALNETTTRLQRIRELAIQASNTGGNDGAAIQAAQDEIEQSIAEINRIAETTQFGTRRILSGNFAATATLATGAAGISVANSPVASTLAAGTHNIAITQTVTGTQTLATGGDGASTNATALTNSTFDTGTYNLVVSNSQSNGTAQAVTAATQASAGAQTQVLDTALVFVTSGGAVAGTGALLISGTFGTGATGAGATFATGDVVTFAGTDLSGNAVTGSITLTGGESVGDLLAALNTAFSGSATASLDTDGSIRLTSSSAGTSQVTFTLTATGGTNQTATGLVSTTGVNGTTVSATGTSLVGVSFAGATLASGNVIQFAGNNAASGAVTGSLTVTASTDVGDLLAAINAAYTGSTASINSSGNIVLTDSTGGVSATSLTFTLTSGATGTSTGAVTTTGVAGTGTASVTFGGGAAVTVTSGETVTLYGATGADGLTPEITLTFGALANGTDTVAVVQSQFTASLDGGNAVTFQNGDQNVRLIGGSDGGFSAGQSLTVNFGANVTSQAITTTATDNSLVFQIGANRNQNIRVSLADLSADNLGFAATSGRSVGEINVTSFSGAQDAISVIDEALSQVSRVRSTLGAFANRLESTISNLGVAQENLTASESRIRDADIAFETTQFTRNQILVQAGVAILAQANIAPQAVLQLLG